LSTFSEVFICYIDVWFLTKTTRLTPQQLEERKVKGLCFNCDNKYSKGHKCGEKKLFYIDCEEEEEEEQ
jgi:hypothetical protein